MKDTQKQFSVLMSIYKNDVPEYVKLAIESIICQTVVPNEVIIVIDGPVEKNLYNMLETMAVENPIIKLYPQAENLGLGNALKIGMNYCTNELVARMDSDDIALPERFEKQSNEFEKNETLSICGSNIKEFINETNEFAGIREVPQNHEEICEYLKARCPFNHMTVMFKKSEVEKAGGYLPWHLNEDSYLWVRMYLAGCNFYNIQENLVNVRVGKDMYKRRGGYKYYQSEKKLFLFMLENKVINKKEYKKAVRLRYILQVLMPNWLRGLVFKKFARSKK